MKKKLTISQQRLLLCLVMVIIFVLAYQFIYNKYENLSVDYIAKTKEVKAQIDQRKADLAQEETLTGETKKINSQIDEMIVAFPVKLTKEDDLVFIETMEDELGIDIPTVNVLDTQVFYTTKLPIRNEEGMDIAEAALPAGDGTTDTSASTDNTVASDASASTDNTAASDASATTENTTDTSTKYMKGLVSSININFQITEKKFKKLVEYINTYPERTSISDTTLSYDSSTGELIGSMTINRYILAGSGKIYDEPDIGDISIGTDSLFGTGTEEE